MLKSLQFFLLIFCKSDKIVIISPYTAFIIKATKVNNHFKKEGAKYDDNINQVYEENHSNCYGCHGAFSAADKRSIRSRKARCSATASFTAMTDTTAMTSMTVMTDMTVTTDMTAMTSVIRTTIT